jgi:hypothetical protein
VHQSAVPIETPVPILDPTLLVGVVLVVLTVALLAYYVGKYDGRRTRDERRRQVPKAIHEAIEARCVAATGAPPSELVHRAQELVEEIQWRIGPLLVFGGPGAKALEGMVEALKGEPAEDRATGVLGGAKDDKAGQEGHKEAELELATVAVTTPGSQALAVAGLRPGSEGFGASEHETKALDQKGYSRQVRMAVVEFSDFWSRGDCLNELELCQKALAQTAPAPEKVAEVP